MTKRYRVAVLYQTPSGRPEAASYEIDALDEDEAINFAQAKLKADPKVKIGKIDGGDVVEIAR